MTNSTTSLLRETALHAPYELPELFARIGVVEREHSHRVLHLRHSDTRFSSHALCWRLGRHQLGMFVFELLQRTEERVERSVAEGTGRR